MIILSKINTTKNIVDSVLYEMDFSKKEEILFKELIQIIKKSKENGNGKTIEDVMERIEVGTKDDI